MGCNGNLMDLLALICKTPGAVTDSISFVFFFMAGLRDLLLIYIFLRRRKKGRCEDSLIYLPHSSEDSHRVTVSGKSNEHNKC